MRNKRRLKKLLSVLLSVAMVLTMIPVSERSIITAKAETASNGGDYEDTSVIATTDPNGGDAYTLYQENMQLFQHIVNICNNNSEGSVVEGEDGYISLKFSDVKPIALLTLTRGEGENITTLKGVDKLLPNLSSLELNNYYYTKTGHSEVYDYIPNYIESLTVKLEAAYVFNFSCIKDLTNLENLVVSSNTYDNFADSNFIEAESLNNLTNLKKVELSKVSAGSTYGLECNSNNTEIFDLILTIPNLEILNISGNMGVEIIPDTITSKALKTLNISSCGLTSIPDMTGMSTLETLFVSNNSNLIDTDMLENVPVKFSEDEEWVAENTEGLEKIVTTGTKVSDYYIPDEALYSIIKERGDSNRDGILTVTEAKGITSISFDFSNKITDYSGLAKVCPYLLSLDNVDGTNDSCIEEITNCTKLTRLEFKSVSQDAFDSVCNNLSNLTSLDLGFSNGLDINNITKLSELKELDLINVSGQIKNTDKIDNLINLTKLKINSNVDLSIIPNTIDRIVELRTDVYETAQINYINAMTHLSYLYINIYHLKDIVTLDFSNHSNLSYIDIRCSSLIYDGYVEKIILPEEIKDNSDISIDNNTSYSLTLDMSKVITFNASTLSLCNVEISDFSKIQSDTKLLYLTLNNVFQESHLDLSGLTRLKTLEISNNEQLTSLIGLGNLTNIYYLRLSNNNLESVEGLEKLVNLRYVDLSYNKIGTLPSGLDALCTEAGLLYYSEYSSVSNRLDLKGNNLTREVINASGLSEEFTGNEIWMIESITRKYSSNTPNNRYFCYTEITDSYICNKVESDNNNIFYLTSDLTLGTELIDYIKNHNCSLSFAILHEIKDDYTYDYSTRYFLNNRTLNNGENSWTSELGDITLKKPEIEIEAAENEEINKYFKNKPIEYITIKSFDISPYVSCWFTCNSKRLYLINYNSNEIIGFTNNYDDSCKGMFGNKYVVTEYGNCTNNNITGVHPETDYVQRDKDFVRYNSELIYAIEKASVGSEIKLIGNTRNWVEEDIIAQLIEKQIKLIVYYNSYGSGNYLQLTGTTTFDFSKISPDATDIRLYGSVCLTDDYDNCAPYLLFNDTKHTVYYNTVPCSQKAYVYNDDVVNGDKVYIYEIDRVNREAKLVAQPIVEYGYIEINYTKPNIEYVITNALINRTTWTESEEPGYVIITPPDATPDDARTECEINGHRMETVSAKPATCETDGYSTLRCTVCGHEETTTISAYGHKWTEKQVSKEATCTQNGELYYSCTRCNEKHTEVITSKGHVESESYYVDKTPTATEEGLRTKRCTKCNEILSSEVLEALGEDVVVPEPITDKEVTTETGKNSAPVAADSSTVVKKDEAVNVLESKMENTISSKVEVNVVGTVPTMTADLFEKAATANKDITVGVTNAANQLMYSWSFSYDNFDTDKVPDEGLKLSISFATEKEEEIKAKTGETKSVYVSINGYKGQLPGPAKVKTYVGDKYANGETIYLYYYNEDSGKIELVGGRGLKVDGGYVEYTLTHCSVYILTSKTPEEIGAEEEIESVKGEWKHDSTGWWFEYEDTSKGYPASSWEKIEGKWYHFDENGYMQTGWIELKGTWYYLRDSGTMAYGWIADGGSWYYLNGDGAMQTGWTKADGKWYYMDSSGAMKTGWLEDGENWYYLSNSGAMTTGWLSDGGTWYYMDNSGAMQTGWTKVADKWYYMDASGAMQTGWLKDGSDWYYLYSSGEMATKWVSDGGVWYYMKSSGAMATGWVKSGDEWYYMDSSGAMQTGWIEVGDDWYYFYQSGVMAKDTYIGEYYLSSDGSMK